MYRIFLADDEFKVIHGMLRSIDWEALQSEVVGYAQDGEDALEKINRLQPDIVLTDIRMPKKSGLEVIEQMKADYPCAFIIFSGYTEFEYAKKALQMKAVDYLIKPVNLCEIEASIRKAQKQIEQMRAAENPDSIKRKEWLEAVLDGKRPEKRFFQETQRFFLTVLHYERDLTAGLGDKIMQILSEEKAKEREYILLKNRKEMVVLGVADSERETQARKQAFAEKLKLLSREYPQKLYWAQCPVLCDTEQIENAYMEAADKVEMYEFFCGQQEESGCREKNFRQKDQIPFVTRQIMCTDSTQEAEQAILTFFQGAAESGYTPNQIRGLCLELYYSLKYQYQKEYPEILLFEQGQDDSDYFQNSSDLLNLETMKNRILSFYNLVNRQLQMHQSYYQQRMVNRCKTYVEEHLEEPITLATVAESVNMNPAYLSHVFKKTTGSNLFDYITERRIAEAKHLLKTTYLKIFEIAKAVGYPDQRYFCQVFKKKEGMTAVEYRNKKHDTQAQKEREKKELPVS